MASTGVTEKKAGAKLAKKLPKLRLEELIRRYELVIFTLAMHITGDEGAAAEVVEEVFIRLNKEPLPLEGDSEELTVHRCTYDAAVAKLLQRAKKKKESLPD